MLMKQVFFTELKNKCTEINNCETDTAKVNAVIKAYGTILHFADMARQEGLLRLEEELEKLDIHNPPEMFFNFMLTMVMDGSNPRLILNAGLNRCIAFNYPSYEGLMNLMFLSGALMIQAGEDIWTIKQYLKSLLPPCILTALEEKECKNTIPKDLEETEAKKNILQDLCNDKEMADGYEYSLAGQTSAALTKLSDKDIQRLLREIDNKDISVAMKVLTGKARKRIFDNMSGRLAIMIAEDMEYIEPVPLMQADESCAKILKTLVRLVNICEIAGYETETIMFVLDIYDTIGKKNKELKEKYKDIKRLVDDIYNL